MKKFGIHTPSGLFEATQRAIDLAEQLGWQLDRIARSKVNKVDQHHDQAERNFELACLLDDLGDHELASAPDPELYDEGDRVNGGDPACPTK